MRHRNGLLIFTKVGEKDLFDPLCNSRTLSLKINNSKINILANLIDVYAPEVNKHHFKQQERRYGEKRERNREKT